MLKARPNDQRSVHDLGSSSISTLRVVHLNNWCHMCSWELLRDEHACGEIKGCFFCQPWRTDRRKCRESFFFRSGSETSVACVSLQEDLQRRLVNRKQAHLVRVAFYGLTDSNSISWEPEEDEFLSFGLIEWLIWFVTRVCVLCDILPVQLRSSWRKKTITWSSFTSVLRTKGVRWPGPYTAAIKATLSPSFCCLPVTREVVGGMWTQR